MVNRVISLGSQTVERRYFREGNFEEIIGSLKASKADFEEILRQF